MSQGWAVQAEGGPVTVSTLTPLRAFAPLTRSMDGFVFWARGSDKLVLRVETSEDGVEVDGRRWDVLADPDGVGATQASISLAHDSQPYWRLSAYTSDASSVQVYWGIRGVYRLR